MKLELVNVVALTRDSEWVMVDLGYVYTELGGVVVEVIGSDMYVDGRYVGSYPFWSWKIEEDGTLRMMVDVEDVLEYGFVKDEF